MKFAWDIEKADINRRKHGVEFDEATTVFGDPLAGTFPDADHSLGSSALSPLARHQRGNSWWCHTPKMWRNSASSVQDRRLLTRERSMKPEDSQDDLQPEYDFDFSKAVRGKYYKQYREGSNVVVLEPDVAAAFTNADAVNQALRAMLRFAQQTSNLTAHSG